MPQRDIDTLYLRAFPPRAACNLAPVQGQWPHLPETQQRIGQAVYEATRGLGPRAIVTIDFRESCEGTFSARVEAESADGAAPETGRQGARLPECFRRYT